MNQNDDRYDEYFIDVKSIILSIWRAKLWIIGFSLLGAMSSYCYALFVRTEYISRMAVFSVHPTPSSWSDLISNFDYSFSSEKNLIDFAEILLETNVTLEIVRSVLEKNENYVSDPFKILDNLNVNLNILSVKGGGEGNPGTRALDLSFSGGDKRFSEELLIELHNSAYDILRNRRINQYKNLKDSLIRSYNDALVVLNDELELNLAIYLDNLNQEVASLDEKIALAQEVGVELPLSVFRPAPERGVSQETRQSQDLENIDFLSPAVSSPTGPEEFSIYFHQQLPDFSDGYLALELRRKALIDREDPLLYSEKIAAIKSQIRALEVSHARRIRLLERAWKAAAIENADTALVLGGQSTLRSEPGVSRLLMVITGLLGGAFLGVVVFWVISVLRSDD